MSCFERARQKYKPDHIRVLLIAETPPKSDSERFFYFERVDTQDSLFLETMKLLYPDATENRVARDIRRRKKELLNRFKEDGFYLIDSLDRPFEKRYNSVQKVKLIKEYQNQLLEKIRGLLSSNTQVILLAKPVFQANFEFLRAAGIPVINIEPIDFPGSGGQNRFNEKMKKIIM